jgi:riboflavin synthase
MFTGLIEQTGIIRRITARGNYRVVSIEAPNLSAQLQVGESIACDGACLTVVSSSKSAFVVEASQETSARTILDLYKTGARINLERAMKLGDRLGGHLVSGHVDAVGEIASIKKIGESLELVVKFDQQFDSLVIEKGSIAINGISLTINEVRTGKISVNIIPHTSHATTVSNMKEGDAVNLEFDMIGKYILKTSGLSAKRGVTRDKLIESGW